ncbi:MULTISPECIES: DUF4419 domain-containing protein [Streptomyces]|uniref:DUF4419 domain-containing protein n=1 Tax=Streptomyces TaxID=1883 RepID=UPI001F47284C|nr:DUF4419 domain-containing protein [Streptomyces sp. 9-7]
MAYEIDLPLDEKREDHEARDEDSAGYERDAADNEAARLTSELTDLGNEGFLRAVLRDQPPACFHHRSTDRLVGWSTDAPGIAEPTTSLLLRALHTCFTAHLPLSLSPDLLWYAVVHEVAVHVRLNPKTYEGIFTETPGHRQTITVRDDLAPLNWERSINLVQQPLRARIGDEVADLFQPAFSTTTDTDATAMLVALMDVVSPYYRFRWATLCGIPRIRLEGTDRDWRLLAARVRELAEWFEELRPWFTALQPVLDAIWATASGWGIDQKFWRSLYKWESASGGDRVTGWITAFFAHRYTDDGPRPKQSFGPGTTTEDEFPSHVSRVPFRWETPTETLDMAFLGGVLGIEREEEWIRPQLGHAVAELNPSPKRHKPAADPYDAPHTEPDGQPYGQPNGKPDSEPYGKPTRDAYAQSNGEPDGEPQDRPSRVRLPEPWTLADIQCLTGCPQAHLLTTVGLVTHNGSPLHADCVINLDGICAVRARDGNDDGDGNWYLGDLVSDAGDIQCWGSYGPDLGNALRAL